MAADAQSCPDPLPGGNCCQGSSPASHESALSEKMLVFSVITLHFISTLLDLVWLKTLSLCNSRQMYVNDLWFPFSSPCDPDAPDSITWPLSLPCCSTFAHVTDFCVSSILEGGLIFEDALKCSFTARVYLHVERGAAPSKHGCCTSFIMAGAPFFDHPMERYAFFTFHYHTPLRSAFVLIDCSVPFK